MNHSSQENESQLKTRGPLAQPVYTTEFPTTKQDKGFISQLPLTLPAPRTSLLWGRFSGTLQMPVLISLLTDVVPEQPLFWYVSFFRLALGSLKTLHSTLEKAALTQVVGGTSVLPAPVDSTTALNSLLEHFVFPSKKIPDPSLFSPVPSVWTSISLYC